MRLLIAGEPRSGQQEVLELLTKGNFKDRQSLEGLVLDHTFSTRYFSATCGIWVDEFNNAAKWVSDFTSDEAAEVRDALTLFIYTFSRPDPPLDEMAVFARSLGGPGKCIAVGTNGTHGAEHDDIDVIEMDELEQIVHMALFDALDDENESPSDTPHEDTPEAPNMDRDLDDIVNVLKEARNSQTMTEAEKIALVDKIVKELDP